MNSAICIDAVVTATDPPGSFAETSATAIYDIIAETAGPLRLISLSGGSTPFPVYRLLPQLLANADLADKCFWIQTDERLVAANDERSNQKAILASLFADGRLPESHFFAVPLADPCQPYQQIAEAYQQSLKELPYQLLPPAPIDLIILGIGNDGHTASLFPTTDWQQEFDSDFAVFEPHNQPEARLSLTFARIIQARELLFLVSGGSKQQIIEDIFLDPHCECPAAVVARQRQTRWVIDSTAVSPVMRTFF